jgi:hypothetical protein
MTKLLYAFGSLGLGMLVAAFLTAMHADFWVMIFACSGAGILWSSYWELREEQRR